MMIAQTKDQGKATHSQSQLLIARRMTSDNLDLRHCLPRLRLPSLPLSRRTERQDQGLERFTD